MGQSRVSHVGSRGSRRSGSSITEIDCPFCGPAFGAHLGAHTTVTYRTRASPIVACRLLPRAAQRPRPRRTWGNWADLRRGDFQAIQLPRASWVGPGWLPGLADGKQTLRICSRHHDKLSGQAIHYHRI